MKDILERLVAAYGPSGREAEVGRVIADLIRPYVDEVRTDALGNIIASVGSGSRPGSGRAGGPGAPAAGGRIMLCAHMDQAHLIVTEATKEGLLRFSVVGRFEAVSLPGQQVTDRAGVTGVVALEDGTEAKDVASGKMFIDIGAADRESARRLAPVGDVFLPASALVELADDRLSSAALDNRAGCAVLVEVARRLRESSLSSPALFVFSVQGAVAPRGARAAAFGLRPDLGLVVDLVPARSAGKPKSQVELGKGPAIRVKEPGYVAPPEVRDLLAKAAERAGLPYQFDIAVSDEDTSDAAAIEVAGAGVLTGVVGLPSRYIRTCATVVSLRDLEAAAQLLVEVVAERDRR